jgi:TonB family protein
MRRLPAALTLLACCALAQDRNAAPQRSWADNAEYKIADAAASDPEWPTKLADLDNWTANYPASENIDLRLGMYVSAFQQLNQTALGSADLREILGEVSRAMVNKPSPSAASDLDAGEKAANLLLSNPDKIFASANQNPGITETQWALVRAQTKVFAEQVLLALDGVRKGGTRPSQALPLQIAQEPPRLKVEAQYTEEARLAGLEGSVLVTGTISEDGSFQNLKVDRPLGLGLDEQAIAAAAQSRFSAGRQRAQPVTLPVDFVLPSKQSRWHLVGVEFKVPAGAARPTFAAADYPLGPGLSLAAYDEASLLAAIGRGASATVSFDIDERGFPGHFLIVKNSEDVWGPEAAMVIQSWRFHPAMKAGAPVTVPCTLSLVWGPEDFTSHAIAGQVAQLYSPPPQTVTPWRVISKLDPMYTEEARRAGIEGIVEVELTIDEQGAPQNLHVAGSLGAGLTESAQEAVSQWRFEPAIINGRPVAEQAVVRVDFRLSGVTASLPPRTPTVAKPKQ